VLPQPAASHSHTPAHGSAEYARRKPEDTLLYQTLQAHWLQFFADVVAEGGELPAFVKDEFEAYFRCGILAHGFLRVRCKECGFPRAVGFSCKRRGFCPSCLGRRMADTAAFSVDYLFPKVPVRQFVLSVPVALRFRMAYSPDLTTAVLRCFIAAITSHLRRRARKRKIRGDLETGAMTVVQRFGSALGLNVHFHTLAVDGVWARQADGGLLFHPLPAPNDEDVARIARAVCRKVGRLLAREKPTENGQNSLLSELANASVQGWVATGPRRGCRVLRLGTTGEDKAATITGKRCAEVAGFNVHANTSARANERERLEILVRYLARPPIANDCLSQLPDGRLALKLKQVWRNGDGRGEAAWGRGRVGRPKSPRGTTHVVFTPHELIEKLIPLIPRPRAHLVRYHGILGPAAKYREKVVPRPGPVELGRPAADDGAREMDSSNLPKLARLPWAVLLKRVFLVDVLECPKCKGRMKILAAVTAPTNVRRVLESLGLPSEAPRLPPARPPPQTELGSDDFYADPPSLEE
jgi:hypothetical protein